MYISLLKFRFETSLFYQMDLDLWDGFFERKHPVFYPKKQGRQSKDYGHGVPLHKIIEVSVACTCTYNST